MIDWKQRLYAFLLRRALGPFLDVSSAQKLHDSIDVSLQEGKFILKNISLDATYLTEQLSTNCPGLAVRSGRIDTLEINLTLRENSGENGNSMRTQSSLAWRAMKLGSLNESLPVVSLVAESKIQGIFLELEAIDLTRRRPCQKATKTPGREEEPTSKSIVGSYIESALASLELNLRLNNIHIRFCQRVESSGYNSWVDVKISSFSLRDLGENSLDHAKSSSQTIVINKAIEFSVITVETGEDSNSETSEPFHSIVALAEGSGQIFPRLTKSKLPCRDRNCQEQSNGNQEQYSFQQDIEVRLNHQLNFSLDNNSLSIIHQLMLGFSNVSEGNTESDELSIFRQSSMMKNPHIESTDLDREDLKALTGIMRQYREAYHMAEQKQIRGGILVPSNAYLDEAMSLEEIDEESTFDMFFDANDQSIYNATSLLIASTHLLGDNQSNVDHFDQTHTKIQITLLSCCFKINFRQPDRKGQFPHDDEYLLLTLNDMNFSLISNQRTKEVVLNVMHIQLEDAFLFKPIKTIEGYTPLNGGAVKIGTVLGWSEDDGYEENALVSEAPCLNIQLNCTINSKSNNVVDCNMTLLPFELIFRQRTISNISKFVTLAKDGFKSSSQSFTYNEGAQTAREINLSFDCPSISLYLPIMKQTSITSLFERCRETLTSGIARETSIGVVFENTGFELKSHQNENTAQGEVLSGKFWCLFMGLFAISPKGEPGYETQMLRKEIFVASGRVEVNPSIPISLSFIRALPIPTENNLGKESFPIVPAISSFKARQEDDDENSGQNDPDFSKRGKKSSQTRIDLRATDPQIAMIENSETSTITSTVYLPELLVGLTSNELENFLLLVREMQKPSTQKVENSATNSLGDAVSEKLSVAVNFDKATFVISDDQKKSDEGKTDDEIKSFLLAMDGIKCHLFFEGSEIKHFRFLSQDICLYSSHGTTPIISNNNNGEFVKGRFTALKCFLRKFSQSLIVPILFRSQLFTPISQETPSLLFDFIDLSSTKKNSLQQRRIYLTIYHLTYRFDPDSNWIERLFVVVPTLKEDEEDLKVIGDSKLQREAKVAGSMTRIFISLADVNVDYKSPSYFETVSKSVVRIGDFRLSSNMMKPSGPKQSYNISVGDITYHITNDMVGYQHRNENRSLCRSSLILKHGEYLEGRKTPLLGTMPEAVLREFNFVNIVSLDAMDAVVTRRIEDDVSRFDHSKDPSIAISLTVGTLSIHACKDSFACFANSIGELQSKVIGMTDNDLKILKEKSSAWYDSNRTKKKVCGISKETEDRVFLQDITIPTISRDDSCTLLLDGHEWTTVDKDLLPGLVIPPGDEQISGWYNNNHNHTKKNMAPSQIIHQHFPFNSTTELLLEGDMGARRLVGESGDLVLKSRLSIQKLKVKIRFFDGYDWPDKCSTIQRKAAKRFGKSFIIEPLPERDHQGENNEDAAGSSLAMKARLMGELLEPKDDHFEPFFEEVPLPEDKASIIEHEKYLRLSKRSSNVFCQVSFNGVTLRMDSYQQSKSHRLQSILEVSISNLFVAETVSDCKPIKMIGEWCNNNEHPRDTRFGTLMLTMATWAPLHKITKDNKIASEECNVMLQLMPMRCLLDQRAISFIKAFFNGDDGSVKSISEKDKWSSSLHLPPPPTFKTFKIKSWKVKVDYYPIRIDVTALREGSIVELVNLSPIQRMVITLEEVIVLDSDGIGPVFSQTVSSWVKEICATQLHKFLANARPFEPFTDVGQGLTDLVILPYEAFKQGESIQRAMKNGIKSLAETVVFQTLTTTSGLTKMAAGLMADSLRLKDRSDASDPLPSRPLSIPRGIGDARLHAARSLARGVSAANYKIVVVPYREYMRNGVSGAVTSIIKGIPVLLVAPLTGATEAASYTLLGARNALRPDLRKEEEASILQ